VGSSCCNYKCSNWQGVWIQQTGRGEERKKDRAEILIR